jgi:hypothetical protein
LRVLLLLLLLLLPAAAAAAVVTLQLLQRLPTFCLLHVLPCLFASQHIVNLLLG